MKTMLRESGENGILRDLFEVRLYKRNQGRIIRQATFGALALTVAIGVWRLSVYNLGNGPVYQYYIPGALLAAGLWLSYRAVNVPQFADFLISVEAEMNKVSWPTRTELVRSSIVVMVTIFALGAMLFFYDIFWKQLFRLLGIGG
jgi:preprotein translocase subunit SecE